MSDDLLRDLLLQQRDRARDAAEAAANLSAALDELVRRYDAMTDPPLPFADVTPLHPRPVA